MIENEQQLVQVLLDARTKSVFVPRQLLLKVLGEKAHDLLPKLPDLVAVNVERTLSKFDQEWLNQQKSLSSTEETKSQ